VFYVLAMAKQRGQLWNNYLLVWSKWGILHTKKWNFIILTWQLPS